MNFVRAKLTGNADEIMELLHKLEFTNIKLSHKYVTFAYDEHSRGSCMIEIETLRYTRWSDDTRGDIFSLIQYKFNLSFRDTIILIKNKMGWANVNINVSINATNIFRETKNDITQFLGDNVYTQYDVDKYTPIISQTFRRDGIGIGTQIDFDIRYNKESDRIIIFWRNLQGEVVGNTARANFEIDKDYRYKYISEMPFNKREYLFGLYNNKEYIQKSGFCVLVEAEKSTMQAYEFGFRSMCSVGMSHIDKKQIELLYNLGIRQVVLAYDEDKHLIEYINVANNIKQWYNDMEVYALFDEKKQFLPLGSKCSPTDLGKETFENIFNNCLKKL